MNIAVSFWVKKYDFSYTCSQRPRMDLNKKSLPRPKTTTAQKPIPNMSNINKN